ncbi:MAG: hypothetical protein HOV94_44320 [Saccharothrix sp.]|nr:hypothetical protein [Saccharothrix sp.]
MKRRMTAMLATASLVFGTMAGVAGPAAAQTISPDVCRLGGGIVIVTGTEGLMCAGGAFHGFPVERDK